jgi:2'-5' RNA ligase
MSDTSSLTARPLRLFFACWPDAALQEQLAQLGRQLQRQSGGKPSRRENLHLTLVFLGDVASSDLP